VSQPPDAEQRIDLDAANRKLSDWTPWRFLLAFPGIFEAIPEPTLDSGSCIIRLLPCFTKIACNLLSQLGLTAFEESI
jgi:hypothetical protein